MRLCSSAHHIYLVHSLTEEAALDYEPSYLDSDYERRARAIRPLEALV